MHYKYSYQSRSFYSLNSFVEKLLIDLGLLSSAIRFHFLRLKVFDSSLGKTLVYLNVRALLRACSDAKSKVLILMTLSGVEDPGLQ